MVAYMFVLGNVSIVYSQIADNNCKITVLTTCVDATQVKKWAREVWGFFLGKAVIRGLRRLDDLKGLFQPK